MQIRRMRFTRIERDDNALAPGIDFHILDAIDFAERLSQFPHALIAIFAFRGDYNLLNDFVIGALRIKRIGRVRVVWSCWVHVTRSLAALEVTRTSDCLRVSLAHFFIASMARAI
jgi:hypothetical protein